MQGASVLSNSNAPSQRKVRVLAVSSGGGHWTELLRMAPAFEGCNITYVTVEHSYKSQVDGCKFRVVCDATRWNKFKLGIMLTQIAWIVLTSRPDVIISTGAAPGYFAIRLGKLLGARTIWVDSIANIDQLSGSGEWVGKYTDMWLTQWEHLAKPDGPHYFGGVL
jgi:UDP-N-acetylglucosamine:LPS N-acetylglucosamine transferase